MIGISVGKKRRRWGIVAIILMIAVIAILMGRDNQPAKPVRPTISSDGSDKIKEKDVPTLPEVAQEIPEPVTKQTETSAGTSSKEPLTDPAELEQAFIEETMETIPLMIEVEVHQPGVIYFRRKPDWPENLEMAMEEMAYLYKEKVGYEGPVNVVFFISGRPAQAKMFFRE